MSNYGDPSTPGTLGCTFYQDVNSQTQVSSYIILSTDRRKSYVMLRNNGVIDELFISNRVVNVWSPE